MRFVFVAVALFAGGGVACSLLLDDDGLSSAPAPSNDGGPPRDDATTPTTDAGTDVVVIPGTEIGFGSGKHGPLVVTGETIVNTYASLAAEAPLGATTLEMDASLGWLPDDVLLVWETNGLPAGASGSVATTDLASTPVGRHELVRVKAVEPKGTGVVLTIDRPLTNRYRIGSAQLVRVPQHTDVTVTASGGLRASPWDGKSGGIVVILATGNVQIDGVIDVDGRGLRGGIGYRNTNFASCPALDGVPRNGYAAKGEGLAPSGYSASPDAGDARGGRGAITNGGGGGNCHNAGGGGGGNGGGGGHGGRAYVTSGYADVGGFGGSAVVPVGEERIVLGGGGGAGDAEDTGGEILTPGAPGGGAIYVRAATITIDGTMSARGAPGPTGNANGGGGGGAGGTIVVRASTRIACGPTGMLASGGNGTSTIAEGTGPGGGGAGGAVVLAAPTIECTPSVAGGVSGTGTQPDGGTFGPTHGATNGAPGKVVTTP